MMRKQISVSHQQGTYWLALEMGILAVVVLIVYYPALNLDFYGDDWIFYDLAGRLTFLDYLIKYFDPRVQTAWYRPVQGILFRFEFVLFGSEPMGYHLLHILLHWVNCCLLFLIVQSFSQRYAALTTALLFATLPTASLAVFWIGVVDTLETVFYFATLWFWLSYLQSGIRRDYWLAFGAFLLAILTKETAITLPIILLLLEFGFASGQGSLTLLLCRYKGFVLIGLGYALIESIVLQRSVFLTQEGYALGTHMISNFMHYCAILAFPWAFIPIFSYLVLTTWAVLLVYTIIYKKRHAWIVPMSIVILTILPVTPFPFIAHRFLYLPVSVSVLVYALVFTKLWSGLTTQSTARMAMLFALVLVLLDGGTRIFNAVTDLAELQRTSIQSFLDFANRHPHISDGTILYFMDPPISGPNLSGMFLKHYGSNVFVIANDSDRLPRWRDYSNAFMIYFDQQGNQREITIQENSEIHSIARLPATFGKLIALDAYEITGAQFKGGEEVGLLLRWKANQQIDKDYRVVVRLLDQDGELLAQHTTQLQKDRLFRLRRAGDSIVTAHVLKFPEEILLETWQLEVSVCDVATLERLLVEDITQTWIGDSVIIKPVVVERVK